MDTSKAFDVVSHEGMLNSFYDQGVKGTIWKLYESLYQNSQSVVQWQGQSSSPFAELQGIRQGGTSSADSYKAGKNKLLEQLNTTGFKLGHLHVGAVMVADDLALISKTNIDAQSGLLIAEQDANRERYSFNTDKTKVVVINSKHQANLQLNGRALGQSKKEVHLGIHRNEKNTSNDTVVDRVSSARRAAYSLMGAGMNGLNGTGPKVAIRQYVMYVLPTLLYGLEAVTLTNPEIDVLSAYHRKTLRHLQHLPTSTAIPALHLLSGIPPIAAYLHIRILTLFRNIIAAKPDNPPANFIKEIIHRQLTVKDLSSQSWIIYTRKLLIRYNLPSAFSLYNDPPAKDQWMRLVKDAVFAKWTAELVDDARNMTSLIYLNLDVCRCDKMHPVWDNINCQLDIRKATVKAQLLLQRYQLSSKYTDGRKNTACKVCKQDEETVPHMLLHCPAYYNTRTIYLPRILDLFRKHSHPIDPDTIIKSLLDSSHFPDINSRTSLDQLSRNYIFKIHNIRAISLGGTSIYSSAARGDS